MIFDENKLLCQQYLNIVYNNVQKYHEKKQISETSGEILYEGINKLLSHIPLNHNDIFFDLGSGIGKIVLQVFLNSVVKEACGIEIVSTSHQQALRAADRVLQELPEFYAGNRKLSFLYGSFLETPLIGATVVLINAICFSQDIVQALGNIINQSPSIHTVLTLRPINTLQHHRFKKTIRIECSWDTALCYVYTR